MNSPNNPVPMPPVLSLLPTRAEIEDTAAWTERPGRADEDTHADLPPEVRRAIAEHQACRASGKVGKTYTLDEARKMLGLPPPR
jgi:hypothetical protein